jgi:hypothetical protein
MLNNFRASSNITQKQANYKNTKIHAIQFFSYSLSHNNKYASIELTQEAKQSLRYNFDCSKPLTVIFSAGNVGLGKSTWSNALYYAITNRNEMVFEVGDTQVTQTEGIQMYPYPLKANPNCPPILLCDMEGMGGIKSKISANTTLTLLQKLFFIGFAVSSVFCLHLNLRPTSEEISLLKQIIDIFSALKKNNWNRASNIISHCNGCSTNFRWT